MANTIKVRRGTKANLPILNQGELAFTTDTNELFIGDGTTNHEILVGVAISSPADDELLAYDSGSGKWINQTPGEVGVLAADGSVPLTGNLDANGNAIDNLLSLNGVKFSSQYSSLQDALDSLTDGETLVIDTEHTISGGLTLNDVDDITILFLGDGKINASSLPGNTTIFHASGTKTTTSASLAADASAGDTVLSVTDPEAAGFAVGDLILLESDAIWSGTQKFGELCIITAVDDTADTITVQNPIFASYATADNALITKIDPIKNLTIVNPRILGNSSTEDTGIRLTYAFCARIIGAHLDYCVNMGILVEYGYDIVIDRIHIEHSNQSAQGYGVLFTGASQYCKVTNSHFIDVRHGTDASSSSLGAGVPRHITTENCTVVSSVAAGLSCHATADYIHIIGNTIIGAGLQGINAEVPHVDIINNRIYRPTRHGIQVNAVNTQSDQAILIKGNIIEDVMTSGYCGISVTSGTTVLGNIVISNNIIRNADTHGINLQGASGTELRNLVVCNNVIDTTTNYHGIRGYYLLDGVIADNTIKDATENGIDIRYSAGVAVMGNRIVSSLRGILTAYSISPYNHIADNHTKGNTNSNSLDANDNAVNNFDT